MRIDEVVESDIRKAARLIKQDCGPYLQQIKGQVDKLALFRGVGLRGITGAFSRIPCPVNRSPMSTHQFIHQISDNWFEDHFGIKFRSNAVFATGAISEASCYGRVFAIFPIGDFKICYSPVIKDLYDSWDSYSDTHDYALSQLTSEIATEEIDNILRAGKYKTGPLSSAIKSGHEVMVHCVEYYQLHVSAGFENDTLEELQNEISQL